jgi:hypothetical protein
VLAVVGICHLPSSPDLAKVAADFVDAARTYPSALASRCFAFCPTDAQVLAIAPLSLRTTPFVSTNTRSSAAASHLGDPVHHIRLVVAVLTENSYACALG